MGSGEWPSRFNGALVARERLAEGFLLVWLLPFAVSRAAWRCSLGRSGFRRRQFDPGAASLRAVLALERILARPLDSFFLRHTTR